MARPLTGLQELIATVAERGRHLVDRAFGTDRGLERLPLIDLAGLLLGGRGEASGVALARALMARYLAASSDERTLFLDGLAERFAPDPDAIRAAFRAYDAAPGPQTLPALLAAVEPGRQEILRRLNLAPGNTAGLVAMRADLLERPQTPSREALDRDFTHLFASWFNRGFLVLRRIDWTSPALVLEKIIRYEAVHAIASWDDLRRRIDAPDRRCYAFFHPSLADEPLIFVEVALTDGMPAAIEPILTDRRTPIAPTGASTAVFYSISNCQKGLARISVGNFLIKQVVEELRREFPNLAEFVTLSPVPGFRAWAEAQRADPASRHLTAEDRAVLDSCTNDDIDTIDLEGIRAMTERVLAEYFLVARTRSGAVVDPVARFHLGNGARLERLNPLADFSEKGWRESYAAMVNYRYDIERIEENHEAYAVRRVVAASANVQKHLRKGRATAGDARAGAA